MSKNVIITGTSRGIGLELIKLFSNSGFNVLSLSRNITNIEKLNLNNTSCLSFDITKEEDHILVKSATIDFEELKRLAKQSALKKQDES